MGFVTPQTKAVWAPTKGDPASASRRAPAGPAAVERSVYRGHEECARGFASVFETWDEFRFDEVEVRDLGDSVLWLGRIRMRGKASQLELDQEFAHYATIAAGEVFRARAFLSWQEALEATGLVE